MNTRTRVVICGGGAGGLALAIRLSRRRDIDVALIEREQAHLWKPLLHELASGSLDPATHEISYLALARSHGFTFHQGSLEGLNRAEKTVRIAAVQDEAGIIIIPARQIAYDVLVIAIGGIANDFGVPGFEHALKLDTAEQAEALRTRIVRACMSANYAPAPRKVDRLRLVIVGGGATGVELAAEIKASSRILISYGLDRLDPESFIDITIVNADARLLQQLPESLSERVSASLRDLDIHIRNGEVVVGIEKDRLSIRGGAVIEADVIVWAAGVRAADLLTRLDGLEVNRTRQLVVTERLRVTRDENIFALGDCAACPWLDHGGLVPARAQASRQQAVYLARSIPALLAGRTIEPFRYRDLGSLVSLGSQESAIGTLMGFISGKDYRIQGLLARLFYKWLYRQHRATLLGWRVVLLETLGGWIGGLTKPEIKLH